MTLTQVVSLHALKALPILFLAFDLLTDTEMTCISY